MLITFLNGAKNAPIFFVSLCLFLCIQNVFAQVDADGDTYADNVDLDDDNDGILDTDECPTPTNLVNSVFNSTNWTPVIGTGNTGSWIFGGDGSFTRMEEPTEIGTANILTQTISGLNNAVFDSNGNITLSVDILASNVNNIAVSSDQNHLEIYLGGTLYATILNDDTDVAKITTHNSATSDITSFPVGSYGSPVSDYQTIVFTIPNPGIVSADLQFSFESLNASQIGTTNAQDDFSIANVEILGLECDSDGDGTPNHRDTDSDNDGCPDALEGGGNFTYSLLEGSVLAAGTNVDSDGVPTVASGGQTIGSSQNGSIQSDECDPCNSNSSLFTDHDGDGVGDQCDLDDDNDGILDADECSSNSCLSQPMNLSFESSEGIGILDAGRVAEWETSATDNAIEIWSNSFGPAQNIGVTAHEGTQWVEINAYQNASVYIDICVVPGSSYDWSVWHRGRLGTDEMEVLINGVSQGTYSAGNTAWVEHSGSYTVPSGVNVVRLEFKAVSTSTGNNSVGNFIDDISFDGIISSSSTCDTDGDGIPNALDPDSDNDGCPDALEGGGNFTYIQLEGNVLETGTDVNSDGVPTAASGGQSDVSSQNLGVQSDACSPCKKDSPLFSDYDNDGIGDECDLDDDNDGILDLAECTGDNCVPQPMNLGFEDSSGEIGILDASLVSEWEASSSDNAIEIWDNDFGPAVSRGVTAKEGTQWVEINAFQDASVYIDICVVPESSYNWSLWHRGRLGTDEMEVLINGVSQGTYSAGETTWVEHSGSYAVPAGVNVVTLEFKAVSSSTGNNSVGNFVDNVSFSGSAVDYCDLDGDGIINSLDLDSDNDGCSDALEGGSTTISSSDLVFSDIDGGNTTATSGDYFTALKDNLGKTVDETEGSSSYGVPTISGAGQTIGNSQNATDKSACSTTPLPVSLLYFHAFQNGQNVKLTWSTIAEQNNSHFEIESSKDGIHFEYLGRVTSKAIGGKAQKEIDYAYTDSDVTQHTNNIYYRLKQVDFDGEYEYSSIRSVNFRNNMQSKLFPTPVKSGAVVTIQARSISQITIYNSVGHIVNDMQMVNSQKSIYISTDHLSPGVYIVRINSGTATHKLIIH